MFLHLFSAPRQGGVPVGLTEYLLLTKGLDHVFVNVFEGAGNAGEILLAEIPNEWLRKLAEKLFSK